MTIRVMVATDYEGIYALWLTTAGMGLNDVDDSCDGIEKFLRRNANTCFVAERNGEILGVILAGNDGRRGYIYHAAVRESERNRGLGTALTDAAMDALRAEGITKVALVCFTGNDIGNAFWERRGFTVRDDLTYRNRALAELTRIDT